MAAWFYGPQSRYACVCIIAYGSDSTRPLLSPIILHNLTSHHQSPDMWFSGFVICTEVRYLSLESYNSRESLYWIYFLVYIAASISFLLKVGVWELWGRFNVCNFFVLVLDFWNLMHLKLKVQLCTCSYSRSSYSKQFGFAKK